MLRRLALAFGSSCAKLPNSSFSSAGAHPGGGMRKSNAEEGLEAAFSLVFARSKYTYRFKRSANMPGLIFWKPRTPGTRHRIDLDFKALGVYTGNPLPELSTPTNNTGGRNPETGRITVRGRGGGDKRILRNVDYSFIGLDGLTGVVQRVEHDPCRTAFLALTRYDAPGRLPELRYHIAPDKIKAGDVMSTGAGANIATGSTLALRDIPTGVPIHNLEFRPGRGGQIARSASTCASIQVKQEADAIVKLPSGELRLFSLDCRATIGEVSNPLLKLTVLGKAGANRKRGRRPITRGIAMNPVDHPHGGRTNGGRPSCTPWGVYCKGKRTRRRNNPTNKYIITRCNGQPIEKFANAKKPSKQAGGGDKGKSKGKGRGEKKA